MEVYKFIIETVREAGDLLLKYYSQEDKIDFKIKGNDPRNILTEADTAVDGFLKKSIWEKFPGQAIYSEEGGDSNMNQKFLWVLDPIDGTANFSRRIPHFAVCAGLLENMVPVCGAVFNPITNELFSFKKGDGAFLNGKPISVSNIKNLSEAHVFFRAGRARENIDWGGVTYSRLLESANKINNMGSSALDACFVAAGRIEASIYGALTTLDIAGALGIVYEAGGKVTNKDGALVILKTKPQRVIISNNENIEKSLFKIL